MVSLAFVVGPWVYIEIEPKPNLVFSSSFMLIFHFYPWQFDFVDCASFSFSSSLTRVFAFFSSVFCFADFFSLFIFLLLRSRQRDMREVGRRLSVIAVGYPAWGKRQDVAGLGFSDGADL
jgi:hypothetical protein